jgi:phospholipid/cholesterol/gamma-HCH transport system substrate-binding protein
MLLTTERTTIQKGLREATSTLESVNRLLTENHDSIGKVLTKGDDLLTELTQTAKSANTALGDGKNLVQTLQSAQYLVSVLSGRLPKLIDSVEKTLVEAQTLTKLVGPKERDRVFSSLDKLDRLSAQLELVATDSRGVIKKINSGEGTAGALLMKREVYEDLKELVRDLRENPWKLFWKD